MTSITSSPKTNDPATEAKQDDIIAALGGTVDAPTVTIEESLLQEILEELRFIRLHMRLMTNETLDDGDLIELS